MRDNFPLPDDAANYVILDPADPAAGAGLNYLLPDNYWYALHCLTYQFQTAVAVASRLFTMLNSAGGVVLHRNPGYQAQTASLTYQHYWGNYVAGSYVAGTFHLFSAIRPNIYMFGGSNLILDIIDIAGADQLTNAHLVLKRWPCRTI